MKSVLILMLILIHAYHGRSLGLLHKCTCSSTQGLAAQGIRDWAELENMFRGSVSSISGAFVGVGKLESELFLKPFWYHHLSAWVEFIPETILISLFVYLNRVYSWNHFDIIICSPESIESIPVTILISLLVYLSQIIPETILIPLLVYCFNCQLSIYVQLYTFGTLATLCYFICFSLYCVRFIAKSENDLGSWE